MKVCIVYESRRGSTERVARAMAEAVSGDRCQNPQSL
ncbi:flavodoxin family protein [Thermococcus celericrescens]|nr:flavodoxin family protein [Thermococcus celericrescens]